LYQHRLGLAYISFADHTLVQHVLRMHREFIEPRELVLEPFIEE